MGLAFDLREFSMSLELNEHEIKLVRESFQKLLIQADQAVFLFYNRLFATAPETALLFKANPADQRAKFIQMLGQVVGLLDDPEELPVLLQQLGRRHKAYRVQAEHYDMVGDALIWMMEQSLETGFTDETRAVWVKVYAFMSDTAQQTVIL
jgi:hemoglobin-like flavoprotein